MTTDLVVDVVVVVVVVVVAGLVVGLSSGVELFCPVTEVEQRRTNKRKKNGIPSREAIFV